MRELITFFIFCLISNLFCDTKDYPITLAITIITDLLFFIYAIFYMRSIFA